MTPLTPRLTKQSRQSLLTGLAEIGFPEVGTNSVLLALEGVLGTSARENAYLYEVSYQHLPMVEAKSTPEPELPGCVEVTLTVSYAPPNKPVLTRLRGIYCLGEPGEWIARKQSIETD